MQKKIDNPILDDFLKAFELDSKGDDSDGQVEEEYADITESEESFTELSSQFANESMGVKDRGVPSEDKGAKKEESIIDAVHKICNSKLEEVEENIKSEEYIPDIEVEESEIDSSKETKEGEYDRIDILETKEHDLSEETEETEEAEEAMEFSCEDKDEFVDDREKDSDVEENKKCFDNNEELKVEYDPNFNWALKSPSRMYDNFYKVKTAALCKSLVGGEKINFDKIEKEISLYLVDVTSETFDQREVDSKMQEAISYRERLMQISVRVNAQYHKFKEEYEALKGVLARVEYLKPAKRQDGLEYEHLWDIHNYLSRLEALHTSLAQADKIQSEVYQMLSRKVSMYMESKVREVYDNHGYVERKIEPTNKHVNVNYDQLPSNADVVNTKSKIGIVDWVDL